MPRRLFAVLVGVSTTNGAATTMKSAEPMVAAMTAFLSTSLYGDDQVVLALVQPSRAAMLDAFRRVRAEITPNALVVVMYVGHGRAAAADHEFESWALDGSDEFTDEDLAAALGSWGQPGIANVVISDCCFGAGLFTPGSLARARGAPMVCIAGAASDEVVEDANEAIVIMQTLGAAAASQTYQDLRASFAAYSAAGRKFCVFARPETALQHRVLDLYDLAQ